MQLHIRGLIHHNEEHRYTGCIVGISSKVEHARDAEQCVSNTSRLVL